MDSQELLISTIKEMKDDFKSEMKSMNAEIKGINKTLASLDSVHKRLNKLEDDVKDLPRIKIITGALVWVSTVTGSGVIILGLKALFSSTGS